MKKIILLLLLLSPLAFAQHITATSWLVADGDGVILESKNSTEPRSIASITKLMTAMVVLDANQDLEENIKGTTRLELLQLMLVKSDNKAAETLCENFPGGRNACVSSMNFKAWNLGLRDTHYADPSGLNIMNVSTAQELVKIVLASSEYPVIVKASNTSEGRIKKKKRYFAFHNTNPLVASKDFIVSKTGYIRASGGCIVMKIGRAHV